MSFILIILATLSSLLLFYFSINISSGILNSISILMLAIVLFFLMSIRGGIVFFLYAFGVFGALLSSVFSEQFGLYLFEAGEYATITGGAARNAFLSILFFTTIIGVFRCTYYFKGDVPRIKYLDVIFHKAFLAIAFLAITYLSFNLMMHGSPLFLEVDRFHFFTTMPPLYRKVYNSLPLLGFVMGMAFYTRIMPRSYAYLWLFIALVVCIFLGEKFSRILLLLYMFFVSYFLLELQGRVKIRHYFYLIALMAVGGCLIIFNYYLIYGSYDIFWTRLAAQGQMNYTLDNVSGHYKSIDVITKHFVGWGAAEAERGSGISYLMYIIAPRELVEYRLSQGASFTAPFPANFIYFFGYTGAPLLIIATGVVVGAVGGVFYKSITSLNFILSLISGKTLLFLYYAVVMGQMHLVFSLEGGIHLLATFGYFLITIVKSRSLL
ncbi:DUF6418 domain-containing protein [Halomonas sp. AOP22-C1-8]|uniref:DUF6418 domain-containing protein n=1 Tax=Halomonas sp. AOP22-C1-8 TaxID=3457717 RepID=UPI004034A4F5